MQLDHPIYARLRHMRSHVTTWHPSERKPTAIHMRRARIGAGTSAYQQRRSSQNPSNRDRAEEYKVQGTLHRIKGTSRTHGGRTLKTARKYSAIKDRSAVF